MSLSPLANTLLSNTLIFNTLLRASLSGAALFLAVWLACRLRLPAAVRAALWGLVCVKFVLGLFALSPIAVPILTPRVAALPPLLAPVRPPVFAPSKSPPVSNAVLPALLVTAPVSPVVPAAAPPNVLLFVWLAGILTAFGLDARAAARLRRRLRNATEVSDETLTGELASMARRMKVRAPCLRESGEIATPLVTGALRPTLAVPLHFARMLTPDERAMAFAHELAHLKRGDLFWGFGPVLARALFWFHPLARRAAREYGQAREEACDAAALAVTRQSPSAFARLLLKMAGSSPAAPALGLSAGFAALRRRVVVLGSPAVSPRFAVLFLAPCLLAVIPWRLTARALPSRLAVSRVTNSEIDDLGPADGATFAAAVNNAGDVVGGRIASQNGRAGEAWEWKNGASKMVGALASYRHSLASGVNNRGQIVGSSYNLAGFHHAFVGPDGARELGALPGFPFSRALAINDAGQIVGWAQADSKPRRGGVLPARAFVWKNGRMTDLGTLGGPYAAAFGVNNRGQIVGKASVNARQTHAFLWENGAMLDLETLGGPNSLASAVSDNGQIVGASDTADGTRRAFLWENGALTDLGALAENADSEARAVNARGEIVGSSQTEDAATHAVLWRDGKISDLNALLPENSGWTLEDARGINDKGQIVGSGHFHGRPRAFLLSPRL